MAESWAVDGIELPEGFDFPITKLGQTADVHGKGVFASHTPTRVECYVRVRPEPRGYSSHLDIFPSPLHPERRTELAAGPPLPWPR